MHHNWENHFMEDAAKHSLLGSTDGSTEVGNKTPRDWLVDDDAVLRTSLLRRPDVKQGTWGTPYARVHVLY